jgi:hypothetical protein
VVVVAQFRIVSNRFKISSHQLGYVIGYAKRTLFFETGLCRKIKNTALLLEPISGQYQQVELCYGPYGTRNSDALHPTPASPSTCHQI